jgi:seryl-tRNA synthetase
MILLRWIKNNKELFKQKMINRKVSLEKINQFFLMYDQWIDKENELNGLRQQKNQNTSYESNEANKQLKQKIQKTNEEFNKLDEHLQSMIIAFPNILDDSVPQGNNDQANVVISQWLDGHQPQGNQLHFQMVDNQLLEKVITMTQSRFIGLNGNIARLHRAIGNFCLDFLKKEGFEEHLLPCLLNYEGFKNSGHVPFFTDDLFWLENQKMALIPTAEVTISNLLKEVTFHGKDLPLKICCLSPCFRKEAGAAGKDTRGLIRLHQFHKVEMFMITDEEHSHTYHEYMVNLVEKILTLLNLSHRKILLCSGDTGNHSSKTYDLEVWLPLQNRWLEISSCSNVKSFQSVRLKNKYIKGQEKLYTHTLNGSCLPIERTLATILENYQYNDKILIPLVLQSYMNQEENFTI